MPDESLDLRWMPAGAEPATTVLVLPGGGYMVHADHEAEPVAAWLNGLGYHAAVLRYRVAPHRHPAPLDDARAALRELRTRPEVGRLGVLGFSAGGHLAGCCCTLDDCCERPDFGVLCYPVVTFVGPDAHTGSRLHLLGEDATPTDHERWSVQNRVDADTPPLFLWHTAADEPVPPTNTLRLATALAEHGVPFEAHIFERGRHGLGLVADEPAEVAAWTDACAAWLRRR
jgi:acetyl esterase/lipase